MEASPLTRQNRPGSFQPKIDNLYEQLFETHDDAEPDFDDGFWREFFLLRPDRVNLRRRLEHISVDDLLRIQGATQQLFRQAVARIKSGNGVSDESALDTLTVFLNIVLAKRYTNPSSEIIALLAGLDQVDTCFFDFVDAIENVIRSSASVDIRQKAVAVAIALIAGAYQTSLVSYFTHRDLFPTLVKNVDDPHDRFKPILLLGLLANYNKFEFRNPYRLRFEDFVNDAAIQKIILGLGSVCSRSRDHYVAIQEDIEEGWTVSNTLKYIGLGVLAPSRSSTPTRNAPSVDDYKDLFSTLPETDACILLSAYDFTNANKLFANTFITHPVDPSQKESPFSVFLSLTSYILHHAHRSPRSTLYGHLNLITLRILLEDRSLCTKIFSPDLSTSVRLCRQRPPFLPTTSTSRPLAATLFDIAIDTITHNLRRRLSVPLYIATLNIIHRLLSCLLMTRTRFPYHWPLLWQTLLSLLRFLTTYADSIKHDPDLPALIHSFLAVLSLAVCSGDVFLPDTDVYDDLFYKLVENGHLLPRFKSAFSHLSRPSTVAPATIDPHPSTSPTALIDILISISDHFTSILEEEKGKSSTFGSGTKNLSPREVSRVIRKGCESLRVPETEGLERWVKWREVDEKGLVKKTGRQAVEDARRLI
ncbi:MAG: hypothetical protein L6R38_007858 [Xanthoria sp. 2 TBL-2021]|nr:MAG: hypothetical protein L6R38_007858 [Xanthoria sp. 2 TBL-2021]